jgi:hypothetical protein
MLLQPSKPPSSNRLPLWGLPKHHGNGVEFPRTRNLKRMPEPTAMDPSATEPTGTPEAIPPRPPAATTDDPAALKAKLDLVKADNLAKGEANTRLNDQLSELTKQFKELQNNVQSGKHKQLEDQGEYKILVAELRETIKQKDAELEAARQLASSAQQASQEAQMKVMAIARIGDAQPKNAEHLFALLQPNLRASDAGRPVVLNGGVEVPLEQHIANLKKPGSGYEYLFQPNGVRGMNTTAYTPQGVEMAGLTENPYAAGGNLTQQLLLEMQNPELAAQLQAEAGQG